MTIYVCRTLGIALDELAQAQDGDTLRLTWQDANAFSRASVESQAIGMGLDVMVVVAPDVKPDNNR